MDPQRLQQLLAGFATKRVLVLGDVMLDEYIWGEANRVSPEAPVLVVEVKDKTAVPGGAANVVNNVRALGAKALVIGVIGDDEAGRTLAHQLQQNGVDGSRLVVDPTRPTTTKTRIIAHDQQVLRLDREERKKVSPPYLMQLLAHLDELGPGVDGLLISDYDKGVLVPEVAERVLALARTRGVPLAVNPKPGNVHLFRGSTLIVLNRSEAEATAGQKLPDEASLRSAGLRLREQWAVDALVVTVGAQGSLLFEKDLAPVHIPAVPIVVYDVAGAGDTMISALLLALLSGASFREAATLASYAAAVVVKKVGVATATCEEIRHTAAEAE